MIGLSWIDEKDSIWNRWQVKEAQVGFEATCEWFMSYAKASAYPD